MELIEIAVTNKFRCGIFAYASQTHNCQRGKYFIWKAMQGVIICIFLAIKRTSNCWREENEIIFSRIAESLRINLRSRILSTGKVCAVFSCKHSDIGCVKLFEWNINYREPLAPQNNVLFTRWLKENLHVKLVASLRVNPMERFRRLLICQRVIDWHLTDSQHVGSDKLLSLHWVGAPVSRRSASGDSPPLEIVLYASKFTFFFTWFDIYNRYSL